MIYIQKNNEGMPHHFDCACALYGAKDLGLDYKLVTFEEVQSGKWDNLIRQRLFVGSVEFMTEVFKRVDIEQPGLSLGWFKHQITGEMKLKDFQYEKPVFIKPKSSIKAFTGFVVDEYSKSMLNTLDPEIEIITKKVINFISEWRCYIFRKKLVGMFHYSGEIDVDLRGMSEELNSLPGYLIAGYNYPETFVMDIGFTDTKLFSHVEHNDMWAIGNYGVNNDLYVRMLKERYFDIIKRGK